jgi:hypothetical protein
MAAVALVQADFYFLVRNHLQQLDTHVQSAAVVLLEFKELIHSLQH